MSKPVTRYVDSDDRQPSRRTPWAKLTPRQRHQRARRLAKDPGTRATIPTRHLEGFAGADELRRQRALNQRLDSPFVEGSDVTRRQVARDREAAVTLEFAPAEQQLARERQESQQRQANIASWYTQYLADLNAIRAQQAQANTALVAQLQQGAQNAQTADVAAGQQLNQQMAADAALRGTTVDPSVMQTGAQAAGVRAGLGQGFAGMAGTQGQAFGNELAAFQGQVVPLAGRADQVDEFRRRGEIEDAARRLAEEKGAFRTQYTADRRESERKAALERMLFDAELADTIADNERSDREAASRARDRAQRRIIARRKERRQAAAERRRIEQADERIAISREKGARDGRDGRTPHQRRQARIKAQEFRDKIRTAMEDAKTLARTRVEDPPGSGKFRRPTDQEVRDALRNKYKDSTLVDAALELRFRRVKPETAERLRRRGVRVPKKWMRGGGAMNPADEALDVLDRLRNG